MTLWLLRLVWSWVLRKLHRDDDGWQWNFDVDEQLLS